MLQGCRGNETSGENRNNSGGAKATGGEHGSGGGPGSGGTQNSGGKGSGGAAGSGGIGSGGAAASGGASSGGSARSGGEQGSGGSGGGAGSGGSGGVAGSGGSGGGSGSGGSGSGGSGSGGSSGGQTGRPGTGGRTGNGGTTGPGGGSGGAAGSGGSGGALGSGGKTGASNCLTQSAKLSSAIATVGIVTWSSTISGLKSAKIDFGLDTNYGMTAPVDKPKSGDNTTLLLGMKQSKTYHYRITATGSDGDCVGPDTTIQTGALMTGLPKITVATKDKSKLYGGFMLTGQFVSMGGSGGIPAYIVDADGEMVWAYKFPKDANNMVMTYDGQWVWINNSNVPSQTTAVQRVSMDGLTVQDKSKEFDGMNHQMTVLPDETVAFYAYNSSKGCEDIKEYSPSGTVKTIVNSGSAQGGATACHLNNIQYSKDDDTLVFSDLDSQVVVKIKRSDGSTVWILNGTHATFTGDTWKGSEHGLHVLGNDRLMVFNNNSRISMSGSGTSNGDGSGSIALELKLDLTAKKVSKVWSYKSDVQCDIMGDLQRMENGNTVIGYSTQGVLDEVDANGNLLQEWTWPIGASFGYIQKRKTLYGPPPR
jgi:hypothetical protein